jgi:hypothetical protein
MTEYSWDWKPKCKADAENWRELDHYGRKNIIHSEFADESIIKAMAKSSWSENDSPHDVLPTLLDFPGITPELTSWLDDISGNWPLIAQHFYWYRRYSVERWNSNINTLNDSSHPTRAFPASMINELCEVEQANHGFLEIADHFTEQLWHDLTEQGHTKLFYSNGYRGDDLLEPSDIAQTDEEILKLFVDGYNVQWLEKEEELDFEWARERAEDGDGSFHFEDGEYTAWVEEDEPFADPNLAYAIAVGLENDDLELLDEKAYANYLESLYTDDPEMQEVTVKIKSDTPWVGVRYRELSEAQQLNLTNNIVVTLKHPYFGRPDGITRHILQCMVKHDQTADNVKALILLNLPN